MPVALFCGRVRGNYPDGNRRQPPAAARLRPFGRENGRAFAQRYLYYTIFALIASLFCPFSQLFLKCPRSRVFLAISCGFSAPFPLFFLLPPWPFLLLHRPGAGIMRGLPGRLPAGRGGRRFGGPSGRQTRPAARRAARARRPPGALRKIGFLFIRGRRNGRRRYGRGHGNHGPPRGHGRDGRTGPEDHRPACRPTDPPPLGPRLLSRRRTG